MFESAIRASTALANVPQAAIHVAPTGKKPLLTAVSGGPSRPEA